MIGSLSGLKVFVDKNCYTEKVTYRAVAVVVDKNRPNKVKPIYKKKRFVKRTPHAYLVKGVGVIMHPDIHRALQDKMRNSIDSMTRSIFGLSNEISNTTLTTEKLIEAWNQLPK